MDGAEAVAGHAGKAGVVLSVAAGVMICSRFEQVSGEVSGARPAHILRAMRKTSACGDVDRLVEILGGAGTSSPPGVRRVIGLARDALNSMVQG